ncbi:MAG: type 4a pilus biogenesis protein PilO [Candidatus Eisenbacteria bacterium]|uniref:Type 4a pilus biogenesis protein PilO n=1 Tax=Eiseniibacteriota bacterium TaxID=2212470 RepID=A0A849SG87_UNCEI|nr:type 4a pilus biogenesis protein PilO [Candidatus Eisenbacteria bacterium]
MGTIDLKNPAVQKGLLGALLAAGMLGVFFFTHFLPFSFPNKREEIAALKVDFEKKSTELARARASVADLPRFEAEYEQLHQRWTMAAELLPTDKQVAALLRKITLAGQQTGVTFVLFRPGSPRSEAYYTEMPVEVTVNGGYHQVGAFLAELANMRRIVTVSNVRLSTGGKEGDGTASASLTASAYSLNTTATAPAAEAPKEQPKGGANDAKKS